MGDWKTMTGTRLWVFPLIFIVLAGVPIASVESQQQWITFEGAIGPGEGRKIVLISGDEEYRSEEGLPQLAKILATRHGFKCTVLFAIDPKDGTINPNVVNNIPGLHLLDQADLMILFTRFRGLPDAQMQHFERYFDSGRPVIGMRTATHAFHFPEESTSQYKHWDYRSKSWEGGFGRQILGETWIAHHGNHGVESTRGQIVPEMRNHPIVRGCEDIWGSTDVYEIRLPVCEGCQPLVLGEVLKGLQPDDAPVVGERDGKSPNDPMMPVAWTKNYKAKGGKEGRVFTTTMGASQDLESEGLRRLLVNASYWCLGMEDQIPPRSNVELVGTYNPTPFGFDKYTAGLKPVDHRLSATADRIFVKKAGRTLEIKATVPEDLAEVSIQLISSRNRPIVHFWQVSPNDPNQKPRDPKIPRQTGRWYRGPLVQGTADTRDVWFPTVDMELEPGMGAVLEFSKGTEGRALVGGPYQTRKGVFSEQIRIAGEDLDLWENTVVIEPASAVPQEFIIEQRVPAILGTVYRSFTLLSENWAGVVRICSPAADGSAGRELASAIIGRSSPTPAKKPSGQGLQRGRLLAALKATIDFTLASQIKSPESPMNGGFFLFYDLDGKTFRNSYWQWGWGPSIRSLLEVREIPELGLDSDEILRAAESASRASMRYRITKQDDPLSKTPITRWSRSMAGEDFYFPAITLADLLFLAGWAWVPLYEITGNNEYLEESIFACDLTGRLMDQFPIIPHTYAPAAEEWYDFALCETGFGVEGFAETYRATGNKRIKDLGSRFISQHLDAFQREDGLWERLLILDTGAVRPGEYHTRGVGWAMEGLLASHRMNPDGPYLQLAERMAAHLLAGQSPGGFWTFYFNRPKEEVGTTQKGTAIWSYLFYRLYSHTGKQEYLSAARKALVWCLDQQYFGSDSEAWGSIPDANPQSGVGYRKWFNMSCLYTSGFFGLALVEELQLTSQ